MDSNRQRVMWNQAYWDSKEMFGSLFLQFKQSCWWYELLEMVRKVLMTGILVIVPAADAGRPILGMLLAFVFILLLSNVRPYYDAENSHLQQA